MQSDDSHGGRRIRGDLHQLVKPLGFVGLFLLAKYTFWSYIWRRGSDSTTKR
ncbi:AAEL007886-PA [Aedes aegypti]|uniref:AAEL007886-PA n=1 Tax=Aedes aegypti TaxID=7159 RepID=Q170L6_AEDAE|nr:AAEL007886-PA [Aedes aegypti]